MIEANQYKFCAGHSFIYENSILLNSELHQIVWLIFFPAAL